MSRPALVLEVDDRTPPLVVPDGDGFRLEELPRGTRALYAPEPRTAGDAAAGGAGEADGLADLVRDALADPLGCEALPGLLRPGMRLTVAVGDLGRPVPAQAGPDVRRRVVEHVLDLAAAAGVDDVEVVCGTGLGRHLTPRELRDALGERVFRAFHPQGLLRCHDAEEPSGLVHLGTTPAGEEVDLERRLATSDLVVAVDVVADLRRSAPASLPLGFGSARTLRALAAPEEVLQGTGADSAALRAGRVVEEHVRVLHVEVVLSGTGQPRGLGCLGGREWEWSLADQAAVLAARRVTTGPRALRRRLLSRLRAPYAVAGMSAGAADPVRARTTELLAREQVVVVDGASDVVVLGVPAAGTLGSDPAGNPLLAAAAGLGAAVRSRTGTPLVRPGGAVVLFHPAEPAFSPLHHPSHLDLYDEVLPVTTDPEEIAARYEEQYAGDPWYSHLHRTSYAVHGLHPLVTWYRTAWAARHVGDVVWVGADRGAVERMGFRGASTLADALELVTGPTGALASSGASAPSVSYLHDPTRTVVEVR